MPLSVTKLQDFIASRGFLATKYFTLDHCCIFIELLCLRTATVILMYIPSKYNIEMKEGNNIHKLKYIDIVDNQNKPEEYGKNVDNFDMQHMYKNVNNAMVPEGQLEEHMENNYKYNISLQNVSTTDLTDLKSIYRQLKRLGYCVQNLKYKLGIIYRSYMCVIRRDDSINLFLIKNYPQTNYKNFYIITDLELFYNKNEKMIEDMSLIRQSIYRVLDTNQNNHDALLQKVMGGKKDIVTIQRLIRTKKDRYSLLLQELSTMLQSLYLVENATKEEIKNLNSNNPQAISLDMNRIQKKTKLEGELQKINSIKDRIINSIIVVQQKQDDAILNIDQIMFDNTIMLDSISSNFNKLQQYCIK